MVMQTKGEVTKELTRAGVEQEIAELIGDEFMLAELTAGLDGLLDSEEVEEGCAEDIIRMAGREEEGEIKLGDIELKVNESEIPKRIKDELKEKLRAIRIELNNEKLNAILNGVAEKYNKSKVVPREAVGIVAAQSIGEPGTQMSIPFFEKIIIKIDNQIRIMPIGEFVDKLMDTYRVERVNETEICDLPSNVQVKVPSLNELGKIEWKGLISCSRHDYPKKLIHIKTRSGRKIIATDNHSFVIRKDNRILPISGKELKPKDRIPVIKNLPLDDSLRSLEISNYLPKDEWWYGSELKKALDPLLGFSYTIPVGPDQLLNHIKQSNTFEVLDGFVYPYQTHSMGKIPECLKLDPMLGWFLGAYLSEGSVSRYAVNISNTDEAFLSKEREFAKSLNLDYREKDNYRDFARGHDLSMSSRVLVEFLERTCGKGSKGKRVPMFAYSSDEAFIGSLLRGYFDGDGNISVERKVIRASSRSKELIDGIALLLSRIGIFARKSTQGGEYWLSISYRYAERFKEKIGFDTPEKVKRLIELCQIQPESSYDVIEMIPGIGQSLKVLARKVGLPTRLVNNFTKRQRIGRTTLERYARLFEKEARDKGININQELALFRQMLEEDVIWDEIIEIQYAKPGGKVYDLSVEGLETFATGEGVITHNTLRTFHYAGVGAIYITLGLPRIIEVVDARKKPSTPAMKIKLTGEYARNRNKAEELAREIEKTYIRDIKSEIYVSRKDMSVWVSLREKELKRRHIEKEEVKEKIEGMDSDVHVEEAEDGKLRIQVPNKSYQELRKLEKEVNNLSVKGIEGIMRGIVRRENEGDGEYMLYTEGSALKKVRGIEGVDFSRTTTNNIAEIADVLGIEAARNAIIDEMMNTLEEQGLDVDVRHVTLIADAMTMDGEVKSIGRHGLAGGKVSVLSRAAFEVTVDNLLDAAMYGETEELKGVTENVIVGQPIKLGTGAIELVARGGQ